MFSFPPSRKAVLAVLTLVCLGAGISASAAHADDGLPFDEKLLDSMGELPGDIGPLGPVPVPANNPQTPEKIALGKRLYYDTRLSGNGSISCATCHNPGLGFSDARPRANGFSGELGRHSPTVLNAAYYTTQFWDGRAPDLESQAMGPMLAEGEMHGLAKAIDTLVRTDKGYQDQFHRVFGKRGSTTRVAQAIASYERTVVSRNAPFDRYMQGDKKALKLAEKRGLWLFVGKASCTQCHSGPNFSDNQFHNLGVPAAGPLKVDEGRFAVTHRAADRGAFKTPGLRNIDAHAPYMHDGAHQTLAEVVSFYNDGGGRVPNKDPKMQKLGLTSAEQADVVAFLHSLTGEVPASVLP